MQDIMEGVHVLHMNFYIHSDIKPANILRFQEKRLKLSDFGSAQLIDGSERENSYIGSRWYRAPEWVLGSLNYTQAVDIFSCGWVFAEFYIKEAIFQGNYSKEQFEEYCKILGTPEEEDWPEGYLLADSEGYKIPYYRREDTVAERLSSLITGISPEAADLLSKMLEMNPKRRITAEEALNHEFFNEPSEREFPSEIENAEI